MKPFYITTTLPYVNASPHVGFAMEIIRADVIARYKTLMGYEVFFNTGTDEHGQKIFDKAVENNESAQAYVDRYAAEFRTLTTELGLLESVHFIRTTDAHHIAAAQEMWRRCDANGYIYKAQYQTKYCVGCELAKTDSELIDGECPIHPGKPIELIDEENYFFKFSAFTDKLLEFYAAHPTFVTPDFRFNEIKAFVGRGLQDFSISRRKEKMSWGVPVPGDDDHVMYVWFDALTNYISTLGWPEDSATFTKFWHEGTPVQYCGKDNLRQQSAMWQAMLMAAGLPNSHRILINGFINAADGRKMSKSLGNVIAPIDIIDRFAEVTPYAEEVLRYYLTRHINSWDDSGMSMETVEEAYRAQLQNGLGNLTSRLMNMVVNYGVAYDSQELFHNQDFETREDDRCRAYHEHMADFDIQKALDSTWSRIKELDEEISEKQPFKVFKTDPDQARADLASMIRRLSKVVKEIRPIMPRTAAAIATLIDQKKKPEEVLFGRLEN
ncbi:methionine--tRNA ligase [Candidatus Nomurabacteria bacterium]|nr:methionine--tRNA ligase [Candidatus Nomurabacteria bacterium]